MNFLYPPRPELAIPPQTIKHFEEEGFWAQLKKNGTCTCIFIDGDGFVSWKTRHNEPHKMWSPDEATQKYFSKFKNCAFAAELLHSKVKGGQKNTLYLFDIMKWDNDLLLDTTFEERQKILQKIVPLQKNIVIAKNYAQDLTGLFYSLKNPEDEGIVLKNPQAKLRSCLRAGLNSGWQVKCRKPTKNYSF